MCTICILLDNTWGVPTSKELYRGLKESKIDKRHEHVVLNKISERLLNESSDPKEIDKYFSDLDQEFLKDLDLK